MRRLIFLSLLTMFLMSMLALTHVSASNNSSIPAGAQEYADNHFYEYVIDKVDDEDAELYGFISDSKNIRFSELHEVNILSPEFVSKNEKLKNLNNGVKKANEWISVIYQDEQPVNVIGVYEREDGEFEFSVFGYGKDLAIGLDSIDSGSLKLIYEMPADAWYIFNKGKVKPVNDPAKMSINSEYDLGQFRQVIQERYKDSDTLAEDATNTPNAATILLVLVGSASILFIPLYLFFKRKRQHNRV
ncbi:hypothetical protein [Bacillus suaedae]|uniref:LPXTG cell wall anchor domain-containing protein n=1 Tax=Halalkalibacter suaedae TaxID=2822140 RepID=A0A940WVM4_9BACI|nr:hypothetical protein [Bacillus suaedae]MBP3953614.1 hypothetical protein [Bacillus suaedae]